MGGRGNTGLRPSPTSSTEGESERQGETEGESERQGVVVADDSPKAGLLVEASVFETGFLARTATRSDGSFELEVPGAANPPDSDLLGCLW